MNKRIVPLLLSIVMMCSLLVAAVPAWADPADSGVSASVTQASPGETFSVTLKVPGTTKPINEMSLKVNFNKAVFEVTEYTAPAITGMNSMQSNLSEANSHGFFSATYRSISTDADVELTGLELTAKFKVKDGAAAGEQQFTIDEGVSVGSLDSSGLPDILMRAADFAKQRVAVKVVAAPKPATGITLNKSELTLTAGESTSLTATVTPNDSTDAVVWSSSKTDVATVDATGKVTAVAPGEAIITAKAGAKTATCTVKVQAAPCNHGSCTPVPAKDSNCTEKGWDAYKKCDQCGKLFDMNGNLLAEIPYRALNDDHDFDTTAWGYKEADGHAHVCRRNPAHHDEVRLHTPDYEGGATYDYAVKCTKCGHVLEPQRVHGSIRIEVPFKLTVKKTGEMAPGQETFQFAVEEFGAPTTYTVVQDTVETNGEKTYEGKFIFTIRDDLAGNLSEGFVIRQVKGNAAGWTYDETKFYAIPDFAESYESVGSWSFFKFDENGELEHNNPLQEIGFTNSFNAKKPETPKTGDGSMMGLSIALVIVSGAALMGTALYSRRKSR